VIGPPAVLIDASEWLEPSALRTSYRYAKTVRPGTG
jgi:hypothetical protein